MGGNHYMRLIQDAWNRIPSDERRLTLSTVLTLVRFILTPIIVLFLCKGWWAYSFLLFIMAALTDIFDGLLARYLNQQTLLGACLDPIADKVLLISCFLTLAYIKTPFFSIPYWFVWSVLLKDMIVIGGSIFLYIVTGKLRIAPTLLGKITTFVEICFIAWLYLCYFCSWMPVKTYWIVLILLFCMIFISLLQYSRIGLQIWKSTKPQ